MRKFYSMLLALLTFCTLAQAQVLFDATVTLGSNTSASGADQVSKDGVTISTTAGGLGTGQQYRFAKGSETTFTSTVGKITKIVFNCTVEGDTKFGPGCFDTLEGYSYEGNIGTWTGSAESVTFVAGTAQVRALTIAVSIDGKDPEGGEEPSDPDPTPSTGWTSSADAPFTVAGILERAASLEAGQNSDKEVYVKGKVSSITYTFDEAHGTATFSISDDGQTEGEFLCYGTYYLGNRAWVEGDTQIKEGDEVIVYGIVTNYKGTLEMANKKNCLYSLNGVTDGGETPVTIADVTCAQAVELTNALADGATSTETYSVTGYITEVVSNVSRNQQTFWMADTKDGGRVFEAYWANLPEGVSEFKVGSKVKITGPLTKYVKGDEVTPEIKNADVEILEDGGDTPEPQPEMGDWESTVYTPLVVAHALELAATLDASTKSPANVFVKGIISEITEINTQYGNATYYISDDGTTDQQLLVYRGYGLNGAKFAAEDALAVGDHVIVCGQIVNYKGETLEFTTGSAIFNLTPAAVSNLKANVAEGAIYTVAGQRVPAITRHGLYIVGGKKVVK